jgi:glycosyltransferase involved in cell wall biosynthesis
MTSWNKLVEDVPGTPQGNPPPPIIARVTQRTMNARSNSPRILYITTHWPGTSGTASHWRSLNSLRALQDIGSVDVVILRDESTDGHRVPGLSHDMRIACTLEVEPRLNKTLVEKLSWTFNPRSNYPYGCGVGDDAMGRIRDMLSEYDLIWFFKLRGPDAFPNATWPRTVVDIDDVPSTYEQGMLEKGAGLVEHLLTRRRLFSWKRREKLLAERFSVLTVCSEEDRQYLGRIGVNTPIHIIPNGFERPETQPVRNPTAPPRIGFIGLFKYYPNHEGMRWFVNECWPGIKSEVPDARLRLVGPGSDGPLKFQGPDIDGLGWLASPSDEIRTWSLMVVPIRVGGGTRVKIAQAFSLKCPVVSTSLGAYGYHVRDGHELSLADSAGAFSNACIRLIREPESAAQMAERAWMQFLEKWTWDATHPLIWAAVEDCLRLNDRVSRSS